MGAEKPGVCLDCNRRAGIRARGLCQACYKKYEKLKLLDSLYPKVGRSLRNIEPSTPGECELCNHTRPLPDGKICRRCKNNLLHPGVIDNPRLYEFEEQRRYLANKRNGIKPSPTQYEPGDPRKVEVLCQRAEMFLDLFCDGDKVTKRHIARLARPDFYSPVLSSPY